MHAQNHKYEGARELARTRAETFCTKIAQKGPKGGLARQIRRASALWGVQETVQEPCTRASALARSSDSQMLAPACKIRVLHACERARLNLVRKSFRACTRLHASCTLVTLNMLLRRVLATMRLRNLPLHRCCNWTLHGFGRRRASAAPAKGQALPVSLETSHDKNTPDRIVSKGGGGRPAACWLYPVRVRTVLAAGAVSASRAVSVQHPPPFLTPAPPRAACPPCCPNARALCPAAWRTRRACR